MDVYKAITDLADELDAEISRLVTPDPSLVANAPCVLVELPRFDNSSVQLCGSELWQFTLVVIGQPGGYAELKPLSDLLAETLAVCDRLDISYTVVQPAAYVPFNVPLQAEPSMSYEVTIERYV